MYSKWLELCYTKGNHGDTHVSVLPCQMRSQRKIVYGVHKRQLLLESIEPVAINSIGVRYTTIRYIFFIGYDLKLYYYSLYKML